MNYKEAVERYRDDPAKEHLGQLASEICAGMTLREKTDLLHGGYIRFAARMLYGKIFHGSILYLPFWGGGCQRLGIPRYSFSDGPKGAVTGKGTCFPATIARGATFDAELEYRIGTAMAKEVIAAGANYFAGICINLIRHPRGGRSQESYSEDPFLLGRMGAELTKSVQAEGVIACPKHLALNSIENLRFLESSNTDERSLREIYLTHFKKCIDAGALSIMGAYNKVNGVYCCENRQLLSDILRGEWGFDGFTMSDFVWGVHDTATALKAGLDVEMPVPRFYGYSGIRRCIRNGTLSESDVDRAVCNILGVLIRLTPGLKPQPKSVMKCGEHLALAEEAAVKGMVLLKNKGRLLPLPADAKIAVVGPFADTVNVGDKGSNMVVCKDGVTAYAGLAARFRDAAVYNGLDPQKVLKASAAADTVIVCVGCDSKDEGEFLLNAGDKITKKLRNSTGGDRDSLLLKPAHLELLKVLKRAGKKVVTVLYTGSVVLTENLEEYSDAIVMGYYGGIRFGSALASLIGGERNFSGKLPVSIARQESDYPEFLEIGQKPYEIEFGYYNGYYLFDKNHRQPSYPFGFGLSYTDFAIRDVQAAINNQSGISVTARVENTGDRAGAEVVQVYIGSGGPSRDADAAGTAGGATYAGASDAFDAIHHRPLKMLSGFVRAELAPGGSCIVRIDIASEDLKFYDPLYRTWALDAAYHVYVGNSSTEAAYIGTVWFDYPD
ncbi:MAG: beta-glucosidase family protein [Saccharofermentanales bacterium]